MADTAPPPLLAVRDLAVQFFRDGASVDAVRGVSFDLAPGEIRAVVGESGSGKSVTARALAGLLPPAPRCRWQGSIRFAGQSIGDLDRAALRRLRGRGLGYIFQEPSAAINPALRIGPQLVEVLRLHHPELADPRAEAIELLDRVGLRDPAQRFSAYPGELSGGMLQRVVIALAVAPRPRLLVADEPTTALDVTIERQVIELLRSLQQDLGLSILLITHNFGIVHGFATTTQVMWRGEIVESGLTANVLSRPQHPYTQALIECRPQLGQRKPRLTAPFTFRS